MRQRRSTSFVRLLVRAKSMRATPLRRALWFGIVVAAVVSACGDNARIAGDAGIPDGGMPDGGSPDAPPEDLATMCGGIPTTLQEWERCYLKRLCETAVHCSRLNQYTDVQECIGLFDAANGGELTFEERERRRAVDAGRASLDVSAFTQCLVELSPRRCSTAGTAPSCATRFVGTIADGASCYSDAECASPGARCAPADCGESCCLGVCEPRAKVGEPCSTLECEPGLRCGSQSKCVIGDIGSQCTDFLDCDPNAWCDQNAGICKPDLQEGDKCNDLIQCGGETTCVGRKLGESGNPGRCLRVTEPGDVCDQRCLGNLYCYRPNLNEMGACRLLPKHGEGCADYCIGINEHCERGLCVTRPGVGDPCSNGSCRTGLFCTDELDATNPGVCRSRLQDGEGECNQPAQCQSYICSGGQGRPGSCQPTLNTCP